MFQEYRDQLKLILASAYTAIPKHEFCGIGLVIYSDFTQLPVMPLCLNATEIQGEELIQQIINASKASNVCHDGFHFISHEWKLTHKNQYFAPPIPEGTKFLGKNNMGARYVSALLGSYLENVICAGIVSEKDGITIFENGKEL